VIVALLVLAPVVALMPFGSIANRLGAPDKNVKAGNCFCHKSASDVEASDATVSIVLHGPTEVATGSKGEFTVTIDDLSTGNGTPLAGSRFGYGVSLSGDDLGGASLDSPTGKASGDSTMLSHMEPLSDNHFNFTFVGPESAQSVTIMVTALIANDNGATTGDRWSTVSTVVEVKKSREVDLKASVYNKGGVETKNIVVDFYVDGKYVGNSTVESLAAGASQNVSIKWDATFASIGDHEVKIVIGSDNEDLDLDGDNNIITKMITIRPDKVEKNMIEQNEGLIIMLVSIIAILVVFGFVSRR
jgi:hypothetical protein